MPVNLPSSRSWLTLDHIRGLTPDHVTLRTADDLFQSRKWDSCGVAGDVCWVSFPETRRRPIQTAFSFPTMKCACTCGATRFPCRHILTLLLLFHEARPPEGELPSWVLPLLFPADSGEMSRLADDERRVSTREGVREGEKWLGDLIRQGLAGLPKQGRQPWNAAADRLADAYAIGPARELRALATLPGSSTDWPERLLPRLGRLALLFRAFSRLDDLPPAMQGDVWAALGFEGPASGDQVTDHWLVLGKRQEAFDKQLSQFTWLVGRDTQCWALLTETMPGRVLCGHCYPGGFALTGTLALAAGSRPIRARPVGELELMASGQHDRFPATDIGQSLADYAAALAANPWHSRHPFILRDVLIEPVNGSWRLRDPGGILLPLPERFGHGWQLLSLATDRPLTIFGEWDGQVFSPISVFAGHWLSLAMWREIV